MSAAPAPFPPVETPWQHWESKGRDRLRKFWRAEAEAKRWPLSPYDPIPKSAYLVDDPFDKNDFLGNTDKLTYHWLKSESDENGNVRASIGDAADAVKRPITAEDGNLVLQSIPDGTIYDSFKRLQEKHLVQRLEARTRGDKTPSTWHLPRYDEILKALHDDPCVGKTHANDPPRPALLWHNKRSNSRKLLTPEKVAIWHLEALIPPETAGSQIGTDHAARAVSERGCWDLVGPSASTPIVVGAANERHTAQANVRHRCGDSGRRCP